MPRLPSGPTQAFPAGAMTPAQAYQASQGHPSSSVVFPRPSTASPAIPAQATHNIGTPFDPSSSVTSFSTTNSATSRIPTSTSITSFHKPTSQSPSLAEMSKERSATPDYIGKMGQMAPLSPAASPTYDTVSSPTTPTVDMSFHARASTDSAVSLPLPLHTTESLPPGARRGYENRSTSFSGSSREVIRPLSNPAAGLSNPQGQIQTRAPLPSLYPALLSLVSAAFKSYIPLADLTKDGITYKDSFSGQAAVTLIAELIKTSDRNLALLLGRSLDAQKFFHDVTYDHRLRDNPKEVYRFRDRLAAPFTDTNGNGESSTSEERLTRNGNGASSTGMGFGSGLKALTAARAADSSSTMHIESTPVSTTPSRSSTMPFPDSESPDSLDSEDSLPVGVFTLLTDCYSPTCSRDSLCYSINCPRRLEQMKRLNMKPEPGLNRKLSRESLVDVKETGTLWIHSVSQEILDSVDDKEKKRQEAINEVIYTERDFVRDLEYLRDLWVKPLRTQDVIDAKRRDDFVRQVFWNVHDVLSVNHVLAERLTKRQKKEPVVSRIGDIFLERVPLFEPFVTYGAHQLFGKYEFEKEKGANAVFQKFVDDTERKPESRKLELNGYLTKPTTRLGRYPLLLEAVLKYTPDDHPDKEDLPEVIKMIKGFLTKVNAESGKSENIFELAQIEQQLVFRPNERIDLRLRDKNRQLVHKGPLKRRGGNREEIADLLGFLFDHAFLLVKPKWVNKSEQYKVYRRPIPLELLVLITPDEQYNSGKLSYGNARSRLITRHPNSKTNHVSQNNSITAPPKPESKHGFSLTILHLGKKGYSMQLWVDTHIGRKKWLECIDKQQGMLREKSTVFISETITEGILSGVRKVNCSSPYDQGNRMIFGTDEGVYFANLRDEKLREPVKVINLIDVTQVDVIEEFQLLIVLHERCVTTFPLDSLDPSDPNAALKRGKRISSHTSFIKSGICLGKTLVAIVKSSTLSSTIKVMEPVDLSQNRKKTQAGFMRRLNGKDDALKLFKEFYIPTESSSVHFLKTKLCVGCTKGFEIVDLETLDMQGLLDPSDGSLDFVLKRDNVRPIAIYRIEEDFLLCYDEFAFYVNKNGWRSRPKWAIVWEGVPTSFALQYPYVIAFEPTFIEVHHVETGHLVQIIPGNNIQCLFADTPPSRVNAPLPPNRMVYLPPTPGAPPYTRPPNVPGYPVYPNMSYPGHPQQPRQPSNGAYPPHLVNQPPDARVRHPPQTPMGYGMPSPHPPPLINRFVRPQVVFVSDDSHVQFLKFPPASHSHPQRPVITHHQTAPAGHSAKSSR
uniref:Rho guanyl-nucleotide exchange factor n=1 Tax=Cryptococcus bacillisporus CA1280 TaxID=1296109 RepID=A0A0D0TLX0_CRYGA|nr:rho guanyl-nucleotide exchange factor [Cryptococcus bacillisporus CA1280]